MTDESKVLDDEEVRLMVAQDIANHQAAIAESKMTHKQALAWARERTWLNGWPTRRYRLEASAAGNSRLITETEAETLQARHGGKVVQVVHSWAHEKKLRREAEIKAAAKRAERETKRADAIARDEARKKELARRRAASKKAARQRKRQKAGGG